MSSDEGTDDFMVTSSITEVFAIRDEKEAKVFVSAFLLDSRSTVPPARKRNRRLVDSVKDVERAIVYLKRPEFREAWRAWLTRNGLPMDFAAETVCDVCRDEWLFEIEADALKGDGARKI